MSMCSVSRNTRLAGGVWAQARLKDLRALLRGHESGSGRVPSYRSCNCTQGLVSESDPSAGHGAVEGKALRSGGASIGMLTFRGLHATIVGLGREGTALACFLTQEGAEVTVTDLKGPGQLRDRIEQIHSILSPSAVQFALDGHPMEVLEADVIFVSPGVPMQIPLLVEARRRGLLLTSEPRLFGTLCPAPLIGITGSNGKTTTAALVGDILKADGRRTWVGGNIGEPLISVLGEIDPTDAVVSELSSFQLEYFAPQPESLPLPGWAPLAQGYSPHVAGLLNITPNHLDRHPSMAAYVEAKSHICRHQRPQDVCVLGPNVRARIPSVKSRVLLFGTEEVDEGSLLRDGQVVLRLAGRERRVCRVEEIPLRGEHNVANVLAACAIAGAAGATSEAMREAISRFQGMPHRLEFVREVRGAHYFNDSIATTPERACAALRSFDGPVVLLAGGRDKHLPWDDFAELALTRGRHVICFGEAAELIADQLRVASHRLQALTGGLATFKLVPTMEEAVLAASSVARPGDVVLLAPGCTSFDAFGDFEQRGERFRELVGSLE